MCEELHVHLIAPHPAVDCGQVFFDGPIALIGRDAGLVEVPTYRA